jgi:hypothetical protein
LVLAKNSNVGEMLAELDDDVLVDPPLPHPLRRKSAVKVRAIRREQRRVIRALP